ncbi:MAG TPA: c-type cytochrome biogenesis protein CcsB [Oscillatoriaceae cyanobacterium]
MNWPGIENTSVTITFIAAGIAMIVFLAQLVGKLEKVKPIGMGFMGIALLGALSTLVARGIVANHVPWSNLYESMIFMLAGTLVFYFIVEFWYKPRNFGVFAAPLVLIIIGGASILPPGLKAATPLMPSLQSYWIKVHTSSILISYGAFTMAFAASVAYFVLAWRAKQAARENVVQMSGDAAVLVQGGGAAIAGGPNPFEKQMAFFDELAYRLILLGFPLLMFGIITGAMWANGAWGTYWSWDPKETWALITWFIYAAYLHARITRDWTGHRAAALSAVGFVAMLICYIGVNYLSTGLHSYGFLR